MKNFWPKSIKIKTKIKNKTDFNQLKQKKIQLNKLFKTLMK